MTAKGKLACATSMLAIGLFTPAALADPGPGANDASPIVALPSPIDMNVSTWNVDRTRPAGFDNVVYEGRDTIRVHIQPPSTGQSFSDWQGYNHNLGGPAGPASLSGDLWINDAWREGDSTQYVRTGIWGSLLPEGSTAYDNARAIFPIISFTNQGGQGRLEVWDPNHSDAGWVDLGATSSSALSFGGWNRFESRILPGSDTIEYLVNGQTIYTWTAPRGAEDNIATEFWQVYLNPRNNGATTFDSYWSDLTTASLVYDGGTVNAADHGIEVLSGGTGTVTVAQDVQANGVTTGANSQATLAFSAGSGVQTTADGAHGVISSAGSPLSLQGGTVSTTGAGAHGLFATGAGSAILAADTAITVTGAGSYGAAATNGGTIAISGGSVEAAKRALSADGGTITTTNTSLKNVVASNNGDETGAAYAIRGGQISLTGGTIVISGGRNSGLLALTGGTIDATTVDITASGDRGRGVYAGADSNGAGAITLSGGSIQTNGTLSHGLFAKRASGSTGDMVATIDASDVAITVDGTDTNGVYADVGGAIAVTGGSVKALGNRGIGLHAQAADDNLTGGGTITATGVSVETAGAYGYGGFAEKAGQLTIDGGAIATTGSLAYGLHAVDQGSLLTSSADVTTTNEWTYGAFARSGATIDLTGGTITTTGLRGHGLVVDQGATIDSAADVVTHGDRAHGVQAGLTDVGPGGTVTLDHVAITTSGAMAYGMLAYNQAGISGTADISTSGDGSFGASADGDGTITLTGGNVRTQGAGSHALQAVYDDRFAHAGTLTASAIDVVTTGASAAGAFAQDGGSITLTGGTLTTSGEAAHGLVAAGSSHPASRMIEHRDSIVDATDIAVRTTDEGAAGAAIIGQGAIRLTGGSVDASGPALLAQTSANATATFAVSGTSLSSATGQLLLVDRTDDEAGEGLVNLTLSEGARATGDIADVSAKTSGSTNVTIDASELQGAIAGVDSLTLSGNATWRATGAQGIVSTTIGEGGAMIATQSDIMLDGTLIGAGDLTKTGTARLTLAGNGGDYSGTTHIDGGTLALTGSLGGTAAIGAGATFEVSSAFAGNIVNDGALILSRADDSSYAGTLTGAGSLRKTGAGALTFGGDGSGFTGLTTVGEGSLILQGSLGGDAAVAAGATFRIGAGDGDASFAGDVVNDGTVIFSQPADNAYAGTLTGIGALIKQGDATLTYSGNGAAYGGTTRIAGGTLIIDGTLGGSALVDEGATFQIGAGATAGSFSGPIEVNGSLSFAGTGDTAQGGALTGTGTILKGGAGRLTYGGNGSAFAGVTTIGSGTLLLTGSLGGKAIIAQGATLGLDGGALTADLTNSGTFAISGTANTIYAGKLTGNGAILKTGSGTIALTGNGSGFTGNTTISGGAMLLTGSLGGTVTIDSAGTLQIGDGLASGDLIASTINNGTMIFNQTGDYNYAGALSGNGGLIKRGAGVLLLSGDYRYVGSTVVEGGLVKLASQLDVKTDLVIDKGTFDLSNKTQEVAGLSGASGTLSLGSTGGLTVNQTDNSVFSGSIEGSGTFVKTGGGTLNLAGTSSFSGTVTVDDGTLKVNGVLPGQVTVLTGAELGGNGTIARMQVAQGGTVAPGNSIGTLHVSGNVAFDAGSIYAVEVDAGGNSDKIIATGSAQINGGKVSVLAAAGNYRWTSDYVILTAAGGVSGKFATTTVSLPFLDPLISYGPTTVTLTLVRNDRSFASVAQTPNQRAVAGALDAGPHGSDLYRALSAQPDTASAAAGLGAVSGELWGTTDTLLIDQARRTGDLALGRLQQADVISQSLATGGSASTQTAGGTAIWGQAIGSWNRLQGDGNASRTNQNRYGFITGLDTGLGDWRVGAAFTHGQTKINVDGGGRSTVTSSAAIAYAGGGWGKLRIRGGAAYGWHSTDGNRAVQFFGFSNQLDGSRKGNSLSAFGETSYAARLVSALVEPFVGLTYVHLKSKAFAETGGSAALTARAVKRDATFSTVGLRLGAVLPISADVAITPRLSAAWLHSFGDRAGQDSFTLSNGQAFSSTGLPITRNTASIEAGAQINVLPGGSLGLSYVGNLSKTWKDHGLKLGFSYSF